jgi:hypothetical protein
MDSNQYAMSTSRDLLEEDSNSARVQANEINIEPIQRQNPYSFFSQGRILWRHFTWHELWSYMYQDKYFSRLSLVTYSIEETYVIEYQHRGSPHMHELRIIESNTEPSTNQEE